MNAPNKTTYLSQQKYDELKQELAFLRGTRRTEIARQLEEAKAFGDLSENAEYHQAREAQAAVENRINQLEEMLLSVEIVAQHKSSVAEVGTTVTLVQKDTDAERIFQLVGSEEVDMKAGKISPSSPLGATIVGKKVGEMFAFKTPAGASVQYTVRKIE